MAQVQKNFASENDPNQVIYNSENTIQVQPTPYCPPTNALDENQVKQEQLPVSNRQSSHLKDEEGGPDMKIVPNPNSNEIKRQSSDNDNVKRQASTVEDILNTVLNPSNHQVNNQSNLWHNQGIINNNYLWESNSLEGLGTGMGPVRNHKSHSIPGLNSTSPYQSSENHLNKASMNLIEDLQQKMSLRSGSMKEEDILGVNGPGSIMADLKEQIKNAEPTDIDGEKFYLCPVAGCDHKTRFKSNLNTHTLTHTEECPHKCDKCDYATKYKSNLKKHMISHSDEQPHECPSCSYRCKFASNLKTHMLTHEEERPYKCNVDGCIYESKYKSNLKMHMLTHSPEKKFKCDLCEYATKYKSNLLSHMMTHSDDFPYRCSYCHYKTKYKSNLKSHEKTHSTLRSGSGLDVSHPSPQPSTRGRKAKTYLQKIDDNNDERIMSMLPGNPGESNGAGIDSIEAVVASIAAAVNDHDRKMMI